jgi:hypothetical protein
MDIISLPVGGHNPAAEGKLGKVSHEEKTSVVFFLAVPRIQTTLAKLTFGLGYSIIPRTLKHS